MSERVIAPVASLVWVSWLQSLADSEDYSWWVATNRTDDPLQVIVSRVGGAGTNLVTDSPRMLVECFAPTEDEAEIMATVVEAMINEADGQSVDSWFIRKVEWDVGPVSYPDQQGRPRVQMTFGCDIRKQVV